MKSIKIYFFVTIIIFAIVSFSNSTNAQNNSDSKKPEPQVQRISGLNAKFIVALIDDGQGGAWIGTEDEGVFHCDVDNKISQFTTKNGLGDNNGYALAIDKLGRLWVGHLNTGVSVFNGKDWKNYDVIDGPIGERIFDIKICPKDGDVWIATSAGISRYKIDLDNWEHFTREDGLLEDQASTLAFKDDGTLIIGTQCHGLAIFNRTFKGDYKHSKKDCRRSALFAGHFSVDRIEKDKKGELQVKISYEPKRDFEREFGESTVTKWHRKGDIVQFFKPINEEKRVDKKDYLPKSLKTDSFGLRIVSIVPRDPYPIRVVGETKGRLIGWIELDSKVIPLDKDGKPILK